MNGYTLLVPALIDKIQPICFFMIEVQVVESMNLQKAFDTADHHILLQN